MRIGSGGDSKQQGNNGAASYADENNQLRKLHQQRMRRQQQSNQSKMQQQPNEYLSKTLKPFQSESTSSNLPHQLFLNSIISDQRPIRSKPNSISLSSLFQDDPRTFATSISKNIKAVFMTTYGFVMDVLGTIAESEVPFVVVNDTQENGEGRLERNYSGFKNMTLVIPPRTNKGYGVFHTKLWMIRFTSFLRIVICTGNQHAEDWVVWQNAYWYQDFPLKGMKISDYDDEKVQVRQEKQQKRPQSKQIPQQSKQIPQNSNVISLDDDDEVQMIKKPTKKKVQEKKAQQPKNQPKKPFNYEQDFIQTLQLCLKNMFPASFDFQKQTGINLSKYEFSDIKVILIPSIPGRHSLKNGDMHNYGMAKVKHIIKQLGPHFKKGTMTYNTTSMGNVDQNFLRQLYFSFLPHAQSFSSSNYRVIYPSYKYITEQTGGQAQVLYLKKENYYRSELKKEVFYHYEPGLKNHVKGAIPHLKTVIIESTQDKKRDDCIFYIGSHNMTKAAWGTYQKSDSQMNFSNSQLGILMLNMNKEQLFNWLPYKYPPRKYADYDKPFLRD